MRIVNRPLALLVALALLALCVVTIIEVILAALHHAPAVVAWPTWDRWARTTAWDRVVVTTWSIVVGVVGLALLLAELAPPRTKRLRLVSDDPATDAAITRRGLADAALAAALDVDGVSDARVKARARRLRLRAIAAAHETEAAQALAEPVSAAVAARLDALGLAHRPRVAVQVEAGRR